MVAKFRRCAAGDLTQPFDETNIFALLSPQEIGITFANK
jgi:hypothetical protein